MNVIGLISMPPFARAQGVPATRRMTASVSAASITDKPASGACLLRAGLAVARPATYGAVRPIPRRPEFDGSCRKPGAGAAAPASLLPVAAAGEKILLCRRASPGHTDASR